MVSGHGPVRGGQHDGVARGKRSRARRRPAPRPASPHRLRARSSRRRSPDAPRAGPVRPARAGDVATATTAASSAPSSTAAATPMRPSATVVAVPARRAHRHAIVAAAPQLATDELTRDEQCSEHGDTAEHAQCDRLRFDGPFGLLHLGGREVAARTATGSSGGARASSACTAGTLRSPPSILIPVSVTNAQQGTGPHQRRREDHPAVATASTSSSMTSVCNTTMPTRCRSTEVRPRKLVPGCGCKPGSCCRFVKNPPEASIPRACRTHAPRPPTSPPRRPASGRPTFRS